MHDIDSFSANRLLSTHIFASASHQHQSSDESAKWCKITCSFFSFSVREYKTSVPCGNIKQSRPHPLGEKERLEDNFYDFTAEVKPLELLFLLFPLFHYVRSTYALQFYHNYGIIIATWIKLLIHSELLSEYLFFSYCTTEFSVLI